jgi:hypothetical protein
MTRFPYPGLALAALLVACGGGGGGDDDGDSDGPGQLPTEPPEEVVMLTNEGFTDPMDAVASPDGETFYFTAYTDDAARLAGIFSVPAAGGAVSVLASGPPLEHPAGLLVTADGSSLIVSDMGVQAGESGEDGAESSQSVLYTISTSGGALSAMSSGGISEAVGLALGPDEETLYVAGYTTDGEPALFKMPITGGTAEVVLAGAPLEQPAGLYVDGDSVAWFMDPRPSRGNGGVLWAIDPEGEASEVVSNLALADPAGVSLVAGGGTAVIPISNEDGPGQLLTVNIDSGDTTLVESTMKSPAGIRTARQAGVFAVADSEGDAIHLAR